MKTTFIIAIVLFAQTISFAADTVNTKITQATVFLSGAQIFRETNEIRVPAGVHKFVVKKVSPVLNPNSLQATGKGNFLILDVQHKTRHYEPQRIKPQVVPVRIQKEMVRLEDSLVILRFEVERVNQKLTNLSGEKDMIIKNKLMTGGGKSDSLPVLKDAIEFYRHKLDEIGNAIYSKKIRQHTLLISQARKQSRLDELKKYNQNISQPRQEVIEEHDIIITTYAEAPAKGSISVNYLVSDAGWIPAYDLRAQDSGEPMSITYKANVFQNSGENWDNIKLVLSTYNQNCFNTKPNLGVWRLDYYTPGTQMNVYRSTNFASQLAMQTQVRKLKESEVQIQGQEYVSYEEMSEISKTFSNVEFEIKLPYTVPSDGEHILMVVNNHSIPADFYHYLVPRVSNNGYMMASMDNWEDLNFLSGQANIYFRNTYVGKTNIDPTIMEDTMVFAIGHDQQVISTRKKLKDEVKNIGLLKRKVQTFTFEIVVRNNGSGTINIDIEDQIPVSVNEDIKVVLLDGAGASYTDYDGKLHWKAEMKSGEIKKIKFSYSVEYDRNKRIS